MMRSTFTCCIVVAMLAGRSAAAALLSPQDLFEAAYDRWHALPQTPYATYVAHINVLRKGRLLERIERTAYRRKDNMCLIVGVPLDAHDRPDPPNVSDRCLAPDYAFTFVPQRDPGHGGPLAIDIATPAPEASLPSTIGHVRARARAYDISLAGEEVVRQIAVAHLTLRPVGDPGKHILRDVWIDRATNAVVRLHGVAPLFGPVATVDFTADYDTAAQSETISRVSGFAKAQLLLVKLSADFTFAQTDYAFPASLPAWYFEKDGYARHVHGEPPQALPSNAT